ncbi:hypothetical protein HPB52_011162 [Rhipicephalus sanguineus]|uniref:Peptidase aspartic putative domain-containing protein n=1 Tax=Rhipicephalus sanguineus TaxID=34632 RepID=A0A9D4STV0_RHISA|nr:hypothetical protein HPB52_011162 [Rhipicephalus sanguineus]
MLDSGSQRSFIRTDVAKRLRCRALGIEELSLMTFGNAKLRHQLRCQRVSVTLRGRFDDSTVTLEALQVPEVCSATSPLLDTEVLELLCARKHDAADLFDPETWHPDDISILIRSDAYWKVATGSIDGLKRNSLRSKRKKFASRGYNDLCPPHVSWCRVRRLGYVAPRHDWY